MELRLNSLLLALSFLSGVTAGCTRGFSVSLSKDPSKDSSIESSPNNRAKSEVSSIRNSEAPGTEGGQPGSIAVAGVLVQSAGNQQRLKLRSQITAKQIVGNNSQAQPSALKEENQLQLLPQPKMDLLEQIQVRSDYVSLGCDTELPQISNYLKGLNPQPINLQAKNSLEIQAKVVLLCGKIQLPPAFVTILAEHLILMGVDYSIPNFEGVGFLSAQTKKLSLLGSNSVTTRGQDSAGAIADGPSLLLAVQREVLGTGSLNLTTQGGDRLQTGSGK